MGRQLVKWEWFLFQNQNNQISFLTHPALRQWHICRMQACLQLSSHSLAILSRCASYILHTMWRQEKSEVHIRKPLACLLPCNSLHTCHVQTSLSILKLYDTIPETTMTIFTNLTIDVPSWDRVPRCCHSIGPAESSRGSKNSDGRYCCTLR